MKFKKTLFALVLAGTIALFGCGENRISNMKEYTADFIGNQDGYVTKSELKSVNLRTDIAKRNGKKNVYVPFLINEVGDLEVYSSGQIHTGDSVPSKPISLFSYPGFNKEELMQMAIAGKDWPQGRELTEKDLIDKFGYKEINQKGEISNTYIFRKEGMEKQ